MASRTRTVLDLPASKAKEHFLKQEVYTNMELPPYFVFEPTLKLIESLLGKTSLLKGNLNQAKVCEGVNHVLYGNKDGKYAWRKYELINPCLYVSLVNLITEPKNWKILKSRFEKFRKNKSIFCASVPILKDNDKKKLKASQINEWIEKIERQSLSLSSRYNFVFSTDITDCYGSIYTHSVSWAMHEKGAAKKRRDFNDLLGNKIDAHLQAMSYGETNGIPQGSVLMDFIAEIVLGYADLCLSKILRARLKGKSYKILRYRDDYRIFVNDTGVGEGILRFLTEVLTDLGFKLNPAKTCFNADVIAGSIKKDKFDSMQFGSVPRKLNSDRLLKQLLIIHKISIENPNCGTLKNRLAKLFKYSAPKLFKDNEQMFTGVLLEIGCKNPLAFPHIAGLISYCIAGLSKASRKEVLGSIRNKIKNLANTGLLEVWTQRISYDYSTKKMFREKLCSIASGRKAKLFQTNWIQDKNIRSAINNGIYCDKQLRKQFIGVIKPEEIQVFEY